MTTPNQPPPGPSTGGTTTTPSPGPAPTSAAGSGNAAAAGASSAVKGVPGLIKRSASFQDRIFTAGGEKLAGALPKVAPAVLGKGLALGTRAVPFIGNAVSALAAVNDFSNGDYLKGIADVIGVIPGPIGWAGMALRVGLEFWQDDSPKYGLWDAPDGVNTYMLPAAAAQVAQVGATDAALTDLQKKIFGFADGPHGTVWNSNHPEALRVDTAEVKSALTKYLSDLSDHFHQVETTLLTSGEPYLLDYHQKLAPTFAAMKKLPDYATSILKQLDSSSDGATKLYGALIDANRAARTQLADSGSLSNPMEGTALTNRVDTAVKTIAAANDQLAKLAPSALQPLSVTPRSAISPTSAVVAVPTSGAPRPGDPMFAPAPGLPNATAAAGDKEKADKDKADKDKADQAKKDAEMEKLLNQLASAATKPNLGGSPLGGNPLGGSPLGGLGGGMPLGGSPLGGGSSLGATPPKATPLADKRPTLETPAGRPLADKPELSAARPDNKTVPAASAEPAAPVAPAAAGAGAAGEKPGGFAPKPAAAAGPQPNVADIKGSKVEFPSDKAAKFAAALAAGGPNNPVSVADAAAKAGLLPPVPGQDPGVQVSPADAKPGDLLRVGDKDYLLLDKDRFLDYTSGKVLSADQMPKDLGARGGYFHLADANAGNGSGPVSGPTPTNTAFTVADTPKVPADGSSPATPPPGGAPAAGAPATGTPGVPGKGVGGPANAAATDTGRGSGVPIASKPLDPAAIK